ncbi:MAG TPA: cysteine protease [Thermoanaerobaculia bacterium]|nr:cysteine protease [Thermoanaerobaculia bacterium]
MAWLALPTGWIPDPPDRRDFRPGDERLKKVLRPSKATAQLLTKTAPALPSSIDLTQWFPPIDSQVPFASCTASAAAGILGFFERKAFSHTVIPSRMFLYKVERNLLHQTGDTGAFLRIAMKALRAFGMPPEEFWPFDPRLLDVEPSPFHYAFASNYKAVSYFRLDPAGTTGDELLTSIKTTLSGSLPIMFGLALYPSFEQAVAGKIPLPFAWERAVVLHALVACGFDDAQEITGRDAATGRVQTTRGAVRIRNSWGTTWGDGGYGWLPYDYIRRGLTSDWWSLMKADYLDTGEFGPGTAPEQ